MTARDATDKQLNIMEKRLRQIYLRSYKDISADWDKYMKSHAPKVDSAYKELVEATKSGDKDRIAKAREAYEHAVKNVTVNNKRFRDMRDETCAKLSNLNETAVNYVNGNMPKIYTVNYNAFGNEPIDGYSFSLVNENAVKNLIDTGNLDLYKHVNVSKDIAWNEKFINSQVTQSIIQGESIPEMSERIFPELMRKSTFGGAVTEAQIAGIIKRNLISAIRIARTMTTAAENKGRQDSFVKAQDDGVILTQEWIATRDERTRAWHADLDHVAVKIGQPWVNEFGEIRFPGDPTADAANVYNCRCSIRARVQGFNWNKEKVNAVNQELRGLKEAYKTFVQDLSKTDVINKFIDNNSYINEKSYRDVLITRTKNIEEQSSVMKEISELESRLKNLEGVPKPRSEWTAEDLMKSILGKTPMIQSEESKALEKQIDDLWKKHKGLTGVVSKSDDFIEQMDKKNFLEQIRSWHSDKPQVSVETHFAGFSTKMRIAQFDEDLMNGVGYISEMSPREYLERCAYDIFDSTYESAVLGADAGSVLKYAKQMSDGVEFDMGYLDYNSKKQEGRHRAMAAHLLGIDKIPVYIRGR